VEVWNAIANHSLVVIRPAIHSCCGFSYENSDAVCPGRPLAAPEERMGPLRTVAASPFPRIDHTVRQAFVYELFFP
jgi:hypothetical protein